MDRAILLHALEVASAQRAALARGDVDAYIEGLELQQQTCAALVEGGISDSEDAMAVDEVVEMIRDSRVLLDSLMGEVTQKLGRLRVAKTAASAYLTAVPRSARQTYGA
jgi:hypothetical protein